MKNEEILKRELLIEVVGGQINKKEIGYSIVTFLGVAVAWIGLAMLSKKYVYDNAKSDIITKKPDFTNSDRLVKYAGRTFDVLTLGRVLSSTNRNGLWN